MFNFNVISIVETAENMLLKVIDKLDSAIPELITKINKLEADLEQAKAALTKVQTYSNVIKSFIKK
jgi:prefoldin subunit 5